ncbi:putative uncharacterized protein BRD3OS [Hoplias malabaricus]|uniref:putative uncharacterized protein BRD3OS n=1 Tax=Hoplias malabaricus TaxID=27720 RepID=UPI003462CE11
MSERCPLADKAMSDTFARLRYRDTSLLIWQQQQLELEKAPPASYLNRSQSAVYSRFGNQAIVIRDKKSLPPPPDSGSTVCTVM